MSQSIAGSGGGGGKGSDSSTRAAQEAADSLRSRAYARVLDLVCEGEIEGLVDGLKSVYLDETPIQNADGSLNFSGVTLESRNGSQHQPYIAGFSAVENEVTVNVEVKASQPVVRTITDPDVNAIRIKVSVPVLTRQDATNGDILGASVTFAIDVQTESAGFVQAVLDTISGKTTSRYQRSYYIRLTGSGPWEVRVRRLTPDSSASTLQDRTYVDSYTEVIESKLRYPNSALMGLRIDAAQFASIPRRSYDLKLLRIRVPANYDPTTRHYAGVWDGTFKVAWSDNPAWCFYDLVTNPRYGLGQHIPEPQIDKWALYRAGHYCDGLVPDGKAGFEPRFTCNLYLQSREQAYKVVQDLASVFRGMVYWSGGAITVTQDAPADAVYQFAPANVMDGEFSYQGSSAGARHTVALVSWNDPLDFYRQKVEYVEDTAGIARYGVVQTEVMALGCTSQGQAHRVGKWLLYSEQSESEVVSFKTGLEAAVVRPGDVIKIADPSRGGTRLAGRIQAASAATVTLDQEVPQLAAQHTWQISVVTPAGELEERMVQTAIGATLTLERPFSQAPQAASLWLLSSAEVQAQLFRVVSISESDPGLYDITALAHHPGKYEAIERGWTLQARDISLLSTTPAAPASVSVTETLYRVKNEAQVLLQVSWDQVPGAIEYQVVYRVNEGNLTTLARTASNYTEIRNAQPGQYHFEVRATGVTQRLGQPASVDQFIFGKLAPPADVLGLRVERRATDLLLTWQPNGDADLAGYEVRTGLSWDTGALVGQTDGTQLVHDQSEAGTYFYHVRAYDTSGTYSAGVTTFALNLVAPVAVSQFDVVQSAARLEFRWRPNPEPEVVAYELREGTAWDTAQFLAEIKSTSYTLLAGFDGIRTFWIKPIAAPGIYGSTAVFVTTEVAQPKNANLLVRQDEPQRGFPGVKHFVGVDTVNASEVLRMQSGITQAEYLFEIDLGASPIRAQNSLNANLGATQDDRDTWSNANYAWDGAPAMRQWVYDGSLASVQARFQISWEDVLRTPEICGWRLNGSLQSLGPATLQSASGVSYAAGRYGQGLLVKDTTQAAWQVSVPSVFHVVFWFIPREITTCTAWHAIGPGGHLTLGFDAKLGHFFLEDHLAQQLRVPYALAVDDRICLAVSQTSTERRLFVGEFVGKIYSASAALPPVGAFQIISLQ